MQATMEAYRLSPQQRRLWRLHQARDGRGGHAWLAVEVGGDPDVRHLRGAVEGVVERSEILRTRVRRIPGAETPVQVISGGGVAWTADEDWSAESAARVEARLEAEVLELLGLAFDPERDPLVQASLARVAGGEHLLRLRLAAFVADADTLRMLPEQIGRSYAALVAGGEAPPAPLQYADVAEWQNEALESEAGSEGRKQWARWTAARDDLATLPFPAPAPAAEPAPRLLARRLEPELVRALEGVAEALPAPLPALLLGAVHVLLHRLTGRPEARVWARFGGRGHEELRSVPGPLARYLPVGCRLAGGHAAAEVLKRVARALEEAGQWQDYHDPEQTEEEGIGFAWEEELPATRCAGLTFALRDAVAGLEPPALSLVCRRRGDALELRLSHDARHVPAADAERLAEELHTVLRGIAERPHAAVEALEIVGGRERRQLLEGWNDTARGHPRDACIHELFAAQAARTPGAAALVFGGETLSYAELDARANRLAHHLREQGVGPEARVGVCLERSPELIVALLAVLKAGGAYVPLDPAYPAERMAYILRDAGAFLVVTAGAGGERLPGGARLLHLDRRPPLRGEAGEPPLSGVLPQNAAYVIYTSGSTGEPKGVVVEHRSASVLLHWLREVVPGEERAAVLGSTPVTFDVSVAELFGTLCWGGKLVLVENALALAGLEEEVRLAVMVPTAAAELLRTGGIPASVRALNLAGEALPAELARGLYALGTVETVRNLYGPTEDTVYSAWTEVARDAERVTIGRAVADSRLYVLDPRAELVPVGLPGELYLAGAGVTRGYLGRPALTAERFVPDPFSGEPGARMYRTGDRVRWLASGEVEYLGRLDAQVKVRGFRIELGEIEHALGLHDGVREAVVVAREDAPGDRRLVAYYTAADAAPPLAELREHLRARLPEYMVPSAFVRLDALPLTSSGKLDRRSLPAPGAERPGLSGEYLEPRSQAERQLAAIWSRVLRVDAPGVRDDFFELGGDSFLAVRLMSQIEKEFGRRLLLATLIRSPTIEEMAKLLSPDGGEPQHGHLVAIQPRGSRPPLFCIHPGHGTVLCYQGFRELGPDQPVYGLQALDFDLGREPLVSIEEMAALYVAAIRELQPEGPYFLAGWSFGGVVAFEMGRQLYALGEEVARLVLLDCRHPVTARAMARVDPVLMRVGMLFHHRHLVAGGKPVVSSAELAELPLDGQLALIAGRLGVPVEKLIPGHIEPHRLESYLDIRMARAKGLAEYTLREYPGRITLLRARDVDLDTPFPELRAAFEEAERTPDYGWGRWCRDPVEIRTVPGTHETLLADRNVGGLVRELELCLRTEVAAAT